MGRHAAPHRWPWLMPAGGVEFFTCPRCGLTSYHPKDAEQGYCGACRDWTGRPGVGTR